MKCPSCKISNPDGQKFCGTCGHKLEAACPKCRATNPPSYKFCGQCGSVLTATGSITLARSGLISQIDEEALELLGYGNDEIQGKPFSLFVEREDLVIFFSHLNELTSSAKKQSFEISLKHKEKSSIYVLLECCIDQNSKDAADSIYLNLSEVKNQRQTAVQLQTQQDLLGLIFTVTNNISTAGKKHLARSIEDALKKICLFTKADFTVIWGINRPAKYLEPLYQWCQKAEDPPQDVRKARSVSLSRIKHIVLKLRQEKTIAIPHLTKLEAQEQAELLFWHQDDVEAAICYMIYSGKMPIGMICTTRKTAGDGWTAESIALLQFFGNFISNRLPYPVFDRRDKDKVASAQLGKSLVLESPLPQNGKESNIDAQSSKMTADSDDLTAGDSWQLLPDTTRPMLFDRFSGDLSTKKQTVFARDDGLALITCPKCGRQDVIPLEQFDKLGNAITVDCPCRKKFAAVLEKRRTFRKQVQLEGYFSIGKDFGSTVPDGSLWGQMMVIDLSKNGLRFSSEKAGLVHSGDILMVRFNLDNTNQAPIHKAVRVISATGFEVGCKFEGADSHDITLGFYFM